MAILAAVVISGHLTEFNQRIEYVVNSAKPTPSDMLAVIIPGAFSSDVDGNYPALRRHPATYARLARALARDHIASIRYARPAIGPDSPRVADKTVAERAHVAQSVVNAGISTTHPRRVVIIAHSDACPITRFVITPQAIPSVVVCYGAPDRRLFDELIFQAGERVRLNDWSSIATGYKLSQGVSAVRSGNYAPERDEALTEYLGERSSGTISYLVEMDRLDLPEYQADLRPRMFLQGSDDSIIPRDGLSRLARYGTTRSVNGADHSGYIVDASGAVERDAMPLVAHEIERFCAMNLARR